MAKNRCRKLYERLSGPEDVHIIESRNFDIHALVSNWEPNPPKMEICDRNDNLIAKIPVYDHAPSPDEITSFTGNLSDNQKKHISDFLNARGDAGFTNWRGARSLWSSLH